MLAVVKMPHTNVEISVNGSVDENDEILRLLRSKYDVTVLCDTDESGEDGEELVDVMESHYWQSNAEGRPGRMVRASRYKLNMNQKELSKLTGFSVSVISEYENNRRKISEKAALKLAKALKCDPDIFLESLSFQELAVAEDDEKYG